MNSHSFLLLSYPVYPILVASVSLNSVSTSSQFNLLNSNKTVFSLTNNDMNRSIVSTICRKGKKRTFIATTTEVRGTYINNHDFFLKFTLMLSTFRPKG